MNREVSGLLAANRQVSSHAKPSGHTPELGSRVRIPVYPHTPSGRRVFRLMPFPELGF